MPEIFSPLLYAQKPWYLFPLENDAFQGAGGISSLLLIVLVVVLLPQGERSRARGPAISLALYLAMLWLEHISKAFSVSLPFKHMALFVLLIGMSRSAFLLLTRSWVAQKLFHPPPQIFLDALQGAVYVCVGLITLASADINASSILTAGGVVAALFGFLMKDTLGNLLAGLAMHGEQPFEVGDWIQFNDNRAHIGRVLEINWRATKVLTLDAVEVIIPNSTLAGFPIANFTKPETFSRRSIFFVAPYSEPTERVRRIVLEAVADAWGVLTDPPPSVVTNNFLNYGVEYWVRIFTVEFGSRDRVDGGVRDRIWHALHRHGIQMPVQAHDVVLRQPEPVEQRQLRRREALRCVDFLDPLKDDQIDKLAETAELRHYATGETIIRQGDPGDELFIISSGEVQVLVSHEGEPPQEVGKMGPDQFFGEMSLMTGQSRRATIKATKGCELYVVNKAALAPILVSSAELLAVISQTLETRMKALVTHAQQPAKMDQSDAPPEPDLLQRIRNFFSV